jgi:hypothetical protein
VTVARKDRPKAPRISRQKRLELKIAGLQAEVSQHVRCLGRFRAPAETADPVLCEKWANDALGKIVAALKLPPYVRRALGWKITTAFVRPDAFPSNAEHLAAHDCAEMAVYRAQQAATTNVAERERYERMLAGNLGACAGHLFRAREIDAETGEG